MCPPSFGALGFDFPPICTSSPPLQNGLFAAMHRLLMKRDIDGALKPPPCIILCILCMG